MVCSWFIFLYNTWIYFSQSIISTANNQLFANKAFLILEKKPTEGVNRHKNTYLGYKNYELKKHLGKVMATITDRKQSVHVLSETVIGSVLGLPLGNPVGLVLPSLSHYQPEVLSISDYYPFGMQLPGRQFSSNSYRYGFQGQEKDDEIKGEGNSINYKYRMHDPRLGWFFSVDPLAAKYSHNSVYAFSENRVIDKIELEGLESADYILKAEFSRAFNFDWSKNNDSKYVKNWSKNTAITFGEVSKNEGKKFVNGIKESSIMLGLTALTIAPFIEPVIAVSTATEITSSVFLKQGLDVASEATQQLIVNGGDVSKIDLIDVGAAVLPGLLENIVQSSADYSIENGFESVITGEKSYGEVLIEGIINYGVGKANDGVWGSVDTKNPVNYVMKEKFQIQTGVAGKVASEKIKEKVK